MNKLQYDTVLTTGKSARAVKRLQKKKMLKAYKGQLLSPLGKMRSRQERKATAKYLKIAFNPRYNGAVYVAKHAPYTTKKGYLRYKTKLVEVK